MNRAITQFLADALAQHLDFVYGPAVSRALLPRIEQLIARQGGGGAATPRGPLALTQRDALLITYGDQVQAPPAAPLRVLAEFLQNTVREVISGVHVLPFYPYTSDDGFSVTDYRAVNPELGTWEDVAALGQSFDLMFDAVVNHASAQSAWFKKFLAGVPEYRDFFVTVNGESDLSGVVRPRALPLLTEFDSATGPRRVWTTFSADQVDLNFANPEVLLAILEVLLDYVRRGARFIRLDAIAFLWKEIGTNCLHRPQAHQIIQLMRAVLDAVAPDTLLITETNVPHRDNIAYFGDGRNEAQLVYNFALPPLVLHAFMTGRATELSEWARGLELPSSQVTFFNFLASHDGIGLNPARGILPETEVQKMADRAVAHGGFISYKQNPDGSRSPYEMNIAYFDALSNPSAAETLTVQIARFLTAHAIMLSLRGLPAIYFHSLFGSRGDRAGAETSGIPRRINRQKLQRTDLERELAQGDGLRKRMFTGLKRLLKIRRNRAAFAPAAGQLILAGDARLFAVERADESTGDRMACLHNVSGETVVWPMKESKERWRDELSGESFAGEAIPMAPWQSRWLCPI